MQAQTLVRNDHKERNIRQCVILWRACGDSDHDILGELIMRGYTEEEASRLMAADWEPTETDQQISVSETALRNILVITAGLREKVEAQTRVLNELREEVNALKGQIITPVGVKGNKSGMFPTN